jgi:hypothetical protein
VTSVNSVATLTSHMLDQTKQNDAQFCALPPANRSAFIEVFAAGRRQIERIMSPKIGSPAAPTKCNRRPPNDLRSPAKNSHRQNPTNPEPNDQLLAIVGDPTNKSDQTTARHSSINNHQSTIPPPPKTATSATRCRRRNRFLRHVRFARGIDFKWRFTRGRSLVRGEKCIRSSTQRI